MIIVNPFCLNFAVSVHSDLMVSVVDLLERLNIQYPGDVGIFCTFFLNRILLKPGQAMFLGMFRQNVSDFNIAGFHLKVVTANMNECND